MKKAILLLHICLSQISLSAQLLFKISSDSLVVFSYSGGDEFNQTKLNTNFWKGPWNRANMAQDFRYNDENVRLENGEINFVMLKKDSLYKIERHEVDSAFLKETKATLTDGKMLLKYSAGMIVTKQKVHYGLYELRFKVEEGRGLWPSFWFYGGNKNEEIDAFELKGEKNNQVHVDTHCPYGCDNGYKNKIGFKTSWGGWMPVSDYLHNGYNIFLLEWKPDEIIWFINGHPLAYFRGKFNNPMNLFLNTQIAANGRAFKPGPNESTAFPNNFYVDYIRFWQRKPNADQLPVLKVNGDLKLSAKFPSNYSTKPVKKSGLMYIKSELKGEEGLVSLTLSETNKLTINVLGKIRDSNGNITLKNSSREITITDFSKETEYTLDSQETEMELVIKTGSKTFTQKFLIKK